jgi:voltage-gated potassium channel
MTIPLLNQLANSVAPRHYFALLGSVLGLTVLAPLIEHFIWARIAVGGMVFACLLTASLAVKSAARVSILVIVLAVLSGIMWVLVLCDHVDPINTLYFQAATIALTLLFFIITCYIILQDVFRGTINSNKICGAVCVYLLIGFCFAMIHLIIALADVSAYRNNTATIGSTADASPDNGWFSRYPLFVYFSFCTFSTVGYGDVIPISRLARSISCLEATFGQLYLAILVARLVGLHTATISMRYRKEATFESEQRDLLDAKKN